MFQLVKRSTSLFMTLFFVGWISYPGWFNEWYSDLPEKYAYPASLSNQHDPHWGFWYW
jgi:hypothetical protein